MTINAYTERATVVGVFEHQSHAQDAVRELKARGFRDDQIGVLARAGDTVTSKVKTEDSESADMAAVGVTAGAGVGALWALGIAAGAIPALGPAIAGGLLANVLVSALTGAAVAGLAGALVGLGVPEEEAEYYQGEFHQGRTIVTVRAEGRNAEAFNILQHNGAYDMQTRDTYQDSEEYKTKLKFSPPQTMGNPQAFGFSSGYLQPTDTRSR